MKSSSRHAATLGFFTLLLLFSLMLLRLAIAQETDANTGVIRAVKKHKSSNDQPSSGLQPRQQVNQPQTNYGSQPRQQANPPQRSRGPSQAGGGPPQPYVTDQIMSRKLGPEKFQELSAKIQAIQPDAAGGRGAPTSSVWWDKAGARTSNDDAVRPSGTRFFQQTTSAPEPPPVTTGSVRHVTVEEARKTIQEYHSIPGGVVLEGTAAGLGQINSVEYDSRYNAFIVDGRAAYFMRVPPQTVAVLCRAIDQDDKVGVSLGKTALVYGKVPPESALAWDLKLADHFLGSIVFAEKEWLNGYRFPGGFRPETQNSNNNTHVAVFFKFHDFDFQVQEQEIRVAREAFDAEIVPLSTAVSSEGGHLPDENAISQGQIPQAWESNARHVAENIGYYRQERIVDKIFAYGEVAAFIRALKQADFDLTDLAAKIPGG
jgi:hypothetical protein